jgi:hypothetical protein
MNQAWERKPREEDIFKNHRIEDLFLCHICKDWSPWFYFTKGFMLAFDNSNGDNTYKYMDDIEDRGGYRWCCNYCIDKIMYNNKLITITDRDGKIIDIKY